MDKKFSDWGYWWERHGKDIEEWLENPEKHPNIEKSCFEFQWQVEQYLLHKQKKTISFEN
jgi:hypothetical protein